LDTVEGLVKTVDVFDRSISGRQGGFDISKCALQKRMRKPYVFRDRIYLSRLVLCREPTSQKWLSRKELLTHDFSARKCIHGVSNTKLQC
jgi:hypothetical protein